MFSRAIRTALLLAIGGSRAVAAQGSSPGGADTTKSGSVQLATGVRLHYVERGDPKGEIILLLHGYSDSWLSYSRVLPLMSKQYHVYALDLRGHGRSDQPAQGYAMSDLASDVVAFMDARRIRRATVVGHSMGSFVARQVAQRAGDRVARLVLVGSATGVSHLSGLVELRTAVLALTDPVSPDFVREFQYSTVHHPVPDDFMAQAIGESLRLPARVWHGLIEGMFAMPSGSGLGTTAAPVLLMWGDRDGVFPRSELDGLRALFPHAAVVEYADTGHAPHWERPPQFVRDLEAFLATSGR